jgi:peptidyl-prolyl cis-trans isomerase D
MLKYFRNRKTIGYAVGSVMLMLVIVAFIALYLPDFMGPAGASLDNEVANVEGISISAQQFQQTYQMQERVYRAQLGGQYNPALLKQLGLDEMVLQRLIQDTLLVVDAERQGLTVTDQEVTEQITEMPNLQANGQFIGKQAYVRLLREQGITPQQFENQVRRGLLVDKLQGLLMDGVVVDSEEIEQEYRRRNEKANLEYIFVARSRFEDQIEVTDADVSMFYEEVKEDYKLPIQRKLRYMTLDAQSFIASVQVTEREIERYYNQNIHMYETPEQVGASHILLKTAEKDEEEVRRQAEDVLAQVKAGGDFAELAKKYSEDTSAESGGSLGMFGRGEMVPEFEQAAFSMQPGEVSDLVKTTYGFHIIKVDQRQAPMMRPLDSVKDEILNTLRQEKAQRLVEEAVENANVYLANMDSLQALAQRYEKVALQETDFVGREDMIPQLGNSPQARELAFEQEIGKVSPPIRVSNGYVFFEVMEEREPRIPPLEEIEDRVRADLKQKKAMEQALSLAEETAKKLAEGSDPEQTAQAAELELKTSESFLRTGQISEAGKSPGVQEAAFAIELNTFSDPIRADNGYVLLQVTERSGFSDEEFAEKKGEFKEQFINEKKQRAWSSYLQELSRRYTVQINRDLIRQITG